MSDARWYTVWPEPRSWSSHSREVDRQSPTGLIFIGVSTELMDADITAEIEALSARRQTKRVDGENKPTGNVVVRIFWPILYFGEVQLCALGQFITGHRLSVAGRPCTCSLQASDVNGAYFLTSPSFD